jgi:hypothetical protein
MLTRHCHRFHRFHQEAGAKAGVVSSCEFQRLRGFVLGSLTERGPLLFASVVVLLSKRRDSDVVAFRFVTSLNLESSTGFQALLSDVVLLCCSFQQQPRSGFDAD